MIKKILYICAIAPVMLLANNIEVTLERNINNPNPLDIIVKVTNTSDKDTFIEPSKFPYKDGAIMGNLFRVFEDGKEVAYKGPYVSTIKSSKTLSAGDTYIAHVNIKEYYKLTTGTHNYQIHYGDTHNSNTLEIEANIVPQKTRNYKQIKRQTCASNQLSTLSIDKARAQSLAQNAVNTMPTVDKNHALYKKWFGYATSGRYHAVYTGYKKISAGLSHATYDCSPSRYCKNANAFVWPDRPYGIHICSNYWKHNEKDRAKTQVHEISHLYATLATVDGDGHKGYWYYSGAQDLAKINPNLAIHNAYSYGYYAKELALNKPATSTPTTTPSTGSSSPRYYNFNSTKNTEGWKSGNLRDAYGGPKNGAWFFQVSYNDPQLYSPTLNINANVIKKITIRMANAYNPAQFNLLQVFWKGSGQGFSEANSQVISVHNHGGWMTYTIDLSRNPRWQGNIEQIRIDPLIAGDGHWIAIDSISLTR